MKKNKIYIVAIMLCMTCICLSSCSEDESFPTFPAPGWVINANPDYSVSMTAVIALPQNLAPYVQSNDELAAFIGDECRGVASLIDGLYYLLIKGAPGESSKVRFQYYSSKNQYLYATDAYITFEADGVYGTADTPVTLPLEIVQK